VVRKRSVLALAALGLLAGVMLAPSSATAAQPGAHRCGDVKWTAPSPGQWAGAGPARHVVAHNMSCRRARREIRGWLKFGSFPQDQFGWFCQATGRRMLCSAGNGRGAPYVTFTLVPAGTEAGGGLLESSLLFGEFTFAGCDEWPPRVANARNCRARIQVFDRFTGGWSVMVELWWGGRLRAVCFDANTAENPAPGFCRPRVPNGMPVTLFIAESSRPLWRKCWDWSKRKRAWQRTGSPWCGQPIHGHGKRQDYWGGPGRIWTGPPGDWPPPGSGWGSGTFTGRA
jgi:hypothetical protein